MILHSEHVWQKNSISSSDSRFIIYLPVIVGLQLTMYPQFNNMTNNQAEGVFASCKSSIYWAYSCSFRTNSTTIKLYSYCDKHVIALPPLQAGWGGGSMYPRCHISCQIPGISYMHMATQLILTLNHCNNTKCSTMWPWSFYISTQIYKSDKYGTDI